MRTGFRHNLIFAALWIVASVTFNGMAVSQDDFSAPPTTIHDGESGVLLLQDGGVLTGTITRVADWYVVGRAGGQMQLAATRVLFAGHNLSEVYDYRVKHLKHESVDSHLAMAEWCLRYNLIDEAGNELVAARKLGPDHPKLELLNRRLIAAKERSINAAASRHRPSFTSGNSRTNVFLFRNARRHRVASSKSSRGKCNPCL